MAVTRIWPIKGHIGAVIAYAADKRKTDEARYSDGERALLHSIHYAADEDKTLLAEEKKLLVEGINCTPSLSQAQQMRKLSAQGQLDMDAVFHTMTKPKPNQQEKVTMPYQKLPMDKIRRFAKTEPTPQIVQEFLLKAVEHYCRYLDRQKDKGER